MMVVFDYSAIVFLFLIRKVAHCGEPYAIGCALRPTSGFHSTKKVGPALSTNQNN